MRAAHLGIVALAVAAIGGFFVGKEVTGRAPGSEQTLVAPQRRSGSTIVEAITASPPLRTSSIVEVESATSRRESGDGAATPNTSAAASLDANLATPATSGTPLFSQRDTVSASAKPDSDLGKLHKAYRLSCQFDPGYSALIGNGAFMLSISSWQGGSIGYDVIEPDTGRTSMTGSVGATGSNTGTTEMQMMKTAGGITFSGVVPNGDLIVTTIFLERNPRGAYLAVMSTHGAATGHVAQQFYGACDVY